MARKQKPKAKTKAAAKPGLARKPATRASDRAVLTVNKSVAVSESDATPRPSLPNAPEKLAASPDVPTPPQQPPSVRQVDATFGQIVTILMRSPQHKFLPLADLEWLVLPAVFGGQCSVAQTQLSGTAVPVGVALWASVSTTVDQRLSDMSAPGRLQPDEWRSGDIPWLVELVADTRTRQLLLTHLGETVFKGADSGASRPPIPG
jgi:cytolysin-activating lysine-acyltransferase